MTQGAMDLKAKYMVQHRSDLLMKEYIQIVRQSQETLKLAIASLEGAESPTEVAQWTVTVTAQKEKSEQLVLVLQVLNKLNTELAYARADLNDALYKGTGDINVARKRVVWLEDKMGELCCRIKPSKEQDIFVQPKTDKDIPEKTKKDEMSDYNREGDFPKIITNMSQPGQLAGKGKVYEEVGDQKEDFKDENEDLKQEAEVDKAEEMDKEAEIDKEDVEENEKSTFFTELRIKNPTHPMPRTVQLVRPGSPKKQLAKKVDESEDEATAYWKSEHHRFEYSNFSTLAGEIDPLSYRQVGLALPGSFLKRKETEFTELPWNTQLTAKDVKDIHRQTLDRLAVRLNKMQDKIYHAAMLSVQDSSPDHDRTMPDVKASAPEHLRKNKFMPLTLEPVPVPRIDRQITIALTATRGVFYPKPIPPPLLLPVTRTNKSKEFPQFASAFTEPGPVDRPAASRLVDQRNLLEETKLVLYHRKTQPCTLTAISVAGGQNQVMGQDTAHTQKSSVKKVRTQIATTTAEATAGSWKEIKPRSSGQEYQGLRWERVKTIVHNSLNSQRVDERIDAAKQLGLLGCGDAMVFYALKERLGRDIDQRVRYEAARALVLNGCWDDEVLRMILKYIVLGNTEVCLELINTLIDGKNVMCVDKTMPTFLELAKVLSHFCQNPDPEDPITFHAAVLLCCLGVKDANAEARLVKALEEFNNSHSKAKALEILVKQQGKIDETIVHQILHLLKTSPVWKHRVLATQLMMSIGPSQKCVLQKQEEMYELLTKRLWDDPSNEVRVSAAKAMVVLGMFPRACEAVENGLENPDEQMRAQAVISVGTLGMKKDHVIRLLLEMLELDSSEYVRLMVIRTFATLKLADRRVLRALREREKMEGPLGRQSKRALRTVDSSVQNKLPLVCRFGPDVYTI